MRTLQDVVDATLVLKGKLASTGGLKAFRARTGHSPGLALHVVDPAISKVLAKLGSSTHAKPCSKSLHSTSICRCMQRVQLCMACVHLHLGNAPHEAGRLWQIFRQGAGDQLNLLPGSARQTCTWQKAGAGLGREQQPACITHPASNGSIDNSQILAGADWLVVPGCSGQTQIWRRSWRKRQNGQRPTTIRGRTA